MAGVLRRPPLDRSPLLEAQTLPTLPLVESVRQAVLTEFEQRGQPGVSARGLRESILIRNGYYAGRRFSCGDLSAVWWASSGEIVFLAGQGDPTRVLPAPPADKAA